MTRSLPDRFVRPSAFQRFLVVGLSNTTVSFVVFRGALVVGLESAALAQVLSYSAGICWSFFWNRSWTFRDSRPARYSIVPFVSVQASLLVATTVGLGIAVDLLQLPPTPSWIAVMAAATVANYSLCRGAVFGGAARADCP